MASDKEDDEADIALTVIEEPAVPMYLQNEISPDKLIIAVGVPPSWRQFGGK
jgi:hypothetical protein